uniref:Uncharacterized protein n=1 Tax=Treubia lacunosa TaxID=93845 RepID=G4Y9U3_9MARC|nr:hypothetical protein TrlaMp44 [Treubia lacunosa]AEH99739.1 hypothetical protein TrlaMp44 [Treubia lacunosa]
MVSPDLSTPYGGAPVRAHNEMWVEEAPQSKKGWLTWGGIQHNETETSPRAVRRKQTDGEMDGKVNDCKKPMVVVGKSEDLERAYELRRELVTSPCYQARTRYLWSRNTCLAVIMMPRCRWLKLGNTVQPLHKYSRQPGVISAAQYSIP